MTDQPLTYPLTERRCWLPAAGHLLLQFTELYARRYSGYIGISSVVAKFCGTESDLLSVQRCLCSGFTPFRPVTIRPIPFPNPNPNPRLGELGLGEMGGHPVSQSTHCKT